MRPMRLANTAAALLLTLAATPAWAGIHYKSTTHMENPQARGRGMGDMQVEGWADSGKSRVELRESGNPFMKKGTYLISKDSGNWPQWRIDREIVFNTAPIGTEVFAAPVNTSGTAFESGVPQRLPFPPSTGVSTTPQSTPDGQRFLVEVSPVQRAARTSISVVLNWPALLKP